MSKATAEILRKAKGSIGDPAMWAQGLKCGTGGSLPTCAAIAIENATENDNVRIDAARFMGVATGTGAEFLPDLIIWNDHAHRTHAEVMDAFDKAIALAESEGA